MREIQNLTFTDSVLIRRIRDFSESSPFCSDEFAHAFSRLIFHSGLLIVYVSIITARGSSRQQKTRDRLH